MVPGENRSRSLVLQYTFGHDVPNISKCGSMRHNCCNDVIFEEVLIQSWLNENIEQDAVKLKLVL